MQYYYSRFKSKEEPIPGSIHAAYQQHYQELKSMCKVSKAPTDGNDSANNGKIGRLSVTLWQCFTPACVTAVYLYCRHSCTISGAQEHVQAVQSAY